MPEEQDNDKAAARHGRAAQAAQEPHAYTARELMAEAASFDVQPWVVPGVFRQANAERMTEDEFRAAVAEWHGTPAQAEQDQGG